MLIESFADRVSKQQMGRLAAGDPGRPLRKPWQGGLVRSAPRCHDSPPSRSQTQEKPHWHADVMGLAPSVITWLVVAYPAPAVSPHSSACVSVVTWITR